MNVRVYGVHWKRYMGVYCTNLNFFVAFKLFQIKIVVKTLRNALTKETSIFLDMVVQLPLCPMANNTYYTLGIMFPGIYFGKEDCH